MMVKGNLKSEKLNNFRLLSHIFSNYCSLSGTDKIAISIN